jgi:hypothetical protein
MKTLWAGLAAIGLLTTSAIAETPYDRKLEQAAIDIVVGKIGEIRGGFAFDAKPSLVVTPDAAPSGPVDMRGSYSVLDPWQDGLAPAVERKTPQDMF